jgi:hypothetical protein
MAYPDKLRWSIALQMYSEVLGLHLNGIGGKSNLFRFDGNENCIFGGNNDHPYVAGRWLGEGGGSAGSNQRHRRVNCGHRNLSRHFYSGCGTGLLVFIAVLYRKGMRSICAFRACHCTHVLTKTRTRRTRACSRVSNITYKDMYTETGRW